MESNNKGPHFWDETHDIGWYTDIFAPIAKAVEAGASSEQQPLAVDASSNTFTVSGVNVLGKVNNNVRPLCLRFESANLPLESAYCNMHPLSSVLDVVLSWQRMTLDIEHYARM